MTELFSGIKQATLPLQAGHVAVPLFYRDLAYLGVYLLAPFNRVRGLLPSGRMHPYRLTPWHGVVTITASEFRDSGIGPYNAVSIGVPFTLGRESPCFTGLLRRPPEIPMIYLLHLLVTTEAARAAGSEMANFPESLADIRFESDGRWVRCEAGAEGKRILSLAARIPAPDHCPRQRVDAFTLQRGRLLRSELVYGESRAGISRKGSGVRLELGDHLIGLKLRELPLGRVLQYQYYPKGQAVLSLPCESYPI